jgi:TonB family protein
LIRSKFMAAIVSTLGLATAPAAFAQASAPASTPAPMPAPRPDCRPVYPAAALRVQAQGVTHIAFHVDETGKVTSAEVVTSSGNSREHRLLDLAAVMALSRCPITPAHDESGHPIASTVTVDYTWLLQ